MKVSLFFYVIAAITCWGSNCPSLILIFTWHNLKCFRLCRSPGLLPVWFYTVCFRLKTNPSQGVLTAPIADGLWKMQSLHFRCSWLGMAFFLFQKIFKNMYFLEKKIQLLMKDYWMIIFWYYVAPLLLHTVSDKFLNFMIVHLFLHYSNCE